MGLKEILGEELYEQVNEKLDDDTKLIINDGKYVPKDTFNEINEEAKILKEQISERDKQIEQLKEDTNATEELKTKIEELQEKNEQTQTELQQKLEQQRLESEIDKALLVNKARNPKAVKALLKTDELELTDDGLKGLDNQLEKIKESDDYLFEGDTNKEPSGGDEFKGGGGGDDLGHMSMEDYIKARENK